MIRKVMDDTPREVAEWIMWMDSDTVIFNTTVCHAKRHPPDDSLTLCRMLCHSSSKCLTPPSKTCRRKVLGLSWCVNAHLSTTEVSALLYVVGHAIAAEESCPDRNIKTRNGGLQALQHPEKSINSNHFCSIDLAHVANSYQLQAAVRMGNS